MESQTLEEVVEYFYTVRTPHVWASVPVMSTINPYTGEPIKSLDEAKEIALRVRVAGYENDSVATSYGTQNRFKHS